MVYHTVSESCDKPWEIWEFWDSSQAHVLTPTEDALDIRSGGDHLEMAVYIYIYIQYISFYILYILYCIIYIYM